MLASGSGAASRGVMGTAVVFGMTIATLIGIFLIPVCYVFVQSLEEMRKKPMRATPAPAPETAYLNEFRTLSAKRSAQSAGSLMAACRRCGRWSRSLQEGTDYSTLGSRKAGSLYPQATTSRINLS